jgi:hypothetical protein
MKRVSRRVIVGCFSLALGCAPGASVDTAPSAPAGAASAAAAAAPAAYHPIETAQPAADDGDGTEHVASEIVASDHVARIKYNGGPVMSSGPPDAPFNVYFVYYGSSWVPGPRTDLIADFVNNLGSSRWWGINRLYGTPTGGGVTTLVSFGGQVFDAYSEGRPAKPGATVTLTRTQLTNIIGRAISNFMLPSDPNGVYFVVGGTDVSEVESDGGTYCNAFCGWHSWANIGGDQLKIGFLADAGKRCGHCRVQSTSPNGDPPLDAMISDLAHELAETTSDPLINAWATLPTTPTGPVTENADLCASSFGTGYRAPNNAVANVKVGTHDYRIQTNWLPLNGGFCGLRYAIRNDLIWEYSLTHEVRIWQLTNPTSMHLQGGAIGVSMNLRFEDQGDFDGDGDFDTVWLDLNNKVVTHRMQGTSKTGETNLGNVATSISMVRTGDFDGDGRADIAFFDDSGTTLTIWHMASTSSVSLKETRTAPPGGLAPLYVADFDGDGKADIYWVSQVWNGRASVLDSSRFGRLTGPVLDGFRATDRAVGSFQGTSREQALTRKDSDGSLWFLELDDSNHAALVKAFDGPVGWEWTIAGVGDFDGNNRADIVWRNLNSGEVATWSTFGNPFQPWFFNFDPVTFVVSDLNWMIVGTGSDQNFIP